MAEATQSQGVRDLQRFAEAPLRRPWLVIVPFVLTHVAALALSLLLPPRYTSSTLILLAPEQLPTNLVPQISTSTEKTGHRLQTLRQEVHSRTRLEMVARELDPYGTLGKEPLIDTIEGKAASADDVRQAANRIGSRFQLFVEIASGDAAVPLIHAIADLGEPAVCAKIRTGGITPESIPSVDAVASFIAAAAAARVRFKATAGLHHPLRGEYRLTYRSDSPSSAMHGFINVFVAAALAFGGEQNRDLLTCVLSESDAGAFHWEDDQLRCLDLVVPRPVVQAARREFALAFGSCSFTEPIEDLQSLGWMEAG